MKRSLRNKIVSLLAAGAVSIPLVMPVNAAAPRQGSVTISSAEELISFSRNCTLDKWSAGRIVTLSADIDLSGTDFEPVPIFSGTFDGAGHTVSGLKIDGTGSNQGLFRYLEKNAVVKNLSVTGTVSPGGSRSAVGSIAGVNSGTVRDCSFKGTVRGESEVGGIVGVNKESGSVISCSVSGYVYGKSSTGGIAGRSEGTLLKCGSSAGVNLINPDASDNIMDFDPEGAFDQYTSSDNDDNNLLNSYSDSGGIVGYSSGVVQSCTNTGNVGYPHVGYNIGGIAGRQSGYLAGCVNSGAINGRKEVGGIVGQSEPYLTLEPDKEDLEELRTELNKLNDLIDKLLNDAQGTGDDVSDRLSSMKEHTDTAQNSCKKMLDQITDFVDGNIDTINTVTADITNALDKTADAADDLADAGNALSGLSDDLGEAIDILKDIADISDAAMSDIRGALDDLKNASDSLSVAAEEFKKAIEALTDGVVSEDKDAQSDAVRDMQSAVGDMSGALDDISDASDDLDKALSDAGLTDGSTGDKPHTGDGERDDSKPEITLPDDFDSDDIIDTVKNNWENAKDPLKNSADSLENASDQLGKALKKMQEAAEKLDPVSDDVKAALDKMDDAASAASSIGRSLQSAFSEMSGAVRELTENGPRSFSRLGDDFRNASNDLQSSVAAVSNDLEALNRQLKENSGVIADDLRAVNAQLRVISNLVIDFISEIKDSASKPSVGDSFQDTSDKDIAATRQGKVTDCVNNGEVTGDRNIGGIVGAMAIEFDLDPEGDLSGEMRFGATYETKSVLQNSKNYGLVTAKKDCTGGVVGRMELGTAFACENYGEVTGGGSCVGGIVGSSDGVVRGCFAKSVLSGGSYVGGIAGLAKNLRGCYAITTIKEGAEYLGAVSGSVKEDGVLTGNRFVDTGIAGVDGISYADRAEPIAFGDVLKTDNIPKEFTEFAMIFISDGKVVDRIPFKYGDDLSKLRLPEVPSQNGSFGKWSDFDKTGLKSDITVEAVYAPWITITASAQRQDKLALALAEGRFTDDAVLNAAQGTATPPIQSGSGARVIDISLTGTELGSSDVIPLRLLDIAGKNSTVWQLVDGKWQHIDCVRSGQYLLLEMTGTEGTFCIYPQQTETLPLVFIAASAAAVAVIVIIAIKAKKKPRRKTAGRQ